MYPHERSLVKAHRHEPFALLGVNSDKDRQALKQVLKAEQITWRSFWDGGGTSGPIARSWEVHAWPTIYVLDARGVIRYKNVRGEALEAAVARLVHETKAKLVKNPTRPPPVAKAAARPDPGADAERQAAQKLGFAKDLAEQGKVERARQRLQEIIEKYPDSDAAKEARQYLDKLKP